MRKSLIAIVAFAVATSADGADRLRARYELNVREGTELKTVQSASDVTLFNLDQNGIEVSGAIALSFVHE